MIYQFGPFTLDTAKVELHRDGMPVRVEPQVFALIVLLVENQDRMVAKDEIIDIVWNGRFVSDSAVSSRIKSVRQTLGDDGRAQKFVKTIHGQGFRFVGQARVSAPPQTAADGSTAIVAAADTSTTNAAAPQGARPSIAVLPFRLVGIAGPYGAIAEALPHDVIAELSRLRWLFVIARGSSFQFRSADRDIGEIGRLLGVHYCLSGSVEVVGRHLAILAELADTRDGGVVWADRFNASVDDIHDVRARILRQIVVALEARIPMNEARIARLTGTENLDAWSAYHLGLHHMYRFNRRDNDIAKGLFAQAVSQDSGFARAHAGLSFVHFQNAFLKYSDDLEAEVSQARAHAERGLELDPLDPFANCTMGRSHWLSGDLEGSLPWLERACDISPNYAQGIYARAWTETISGRGSSGQAFADSAMSLSPLDPLMYAMLATRSLSHLVRGDHAEATNWAERAARAPGAHVLIALIAAVVHDLGGDKQRAAHWAQSVRQRNNLITGEDFFRSFPFAAGAGREPIAAALVRLGYKVG